MTEFPIIYTPDNEPYLGDAHLKAFDDAIVAAINLAQSTAADTKSQSLSDLQKAAIQIIPQGVSLALSTRELIRQAYLFGALTLVRPLVERAVTMLYLRIKPDALAIWTAGWHYSKRPTLAKMIEEIGGTKFPGVGREITSKLNRITHGDPAAAAWNVEFAEDGSLLAPMGKMVARPDLASTIALDAATYLCILMSETDSAFPQASVDV